jgi:hypothetical protein
MHLTVVSCLTLGRYRSAAGAWAHRSRNLIAVHQPMRTSPPPHVWSSAAGKPSSTVGRFWCHWPVEHCDAGPKSKPIKIQFPLRALPLFLLQTTSRQSSDLAGVVCFSVPGLQSSSLASPGFYLSYLFHRHPCASYPRRHRQDGVRHAVRLLTTSTLRLAGSQTDATRSGTRPSRVWARPT